MRMLVKVADELESPLRELAEAANRFMPQQAGVLLEAKIREEYARFKQQPPEIVISEAV